MSPTLFWYVLRDLLRIFVLSSLTLAGIMSFCGLLKPLTEYGLSGGQIVRMLAYFMPATQTYSLPVAALFATTFVYGRLAADNELNACRASGISYLGMAMPAMVLGLVLAGVSLACLWYVVPRYTLKVEQAAFQSLAEIVRRNIERSHQIQIRPYSIYAESAQVQRGEGAGGGEEVVLLRHAVFCMMKPDPRTRVPVPWDFYTARAARVTLRHAEDQVQVSAVLEGGVKLPRDVLEGDGIGGVEMLQFGPVALESPIRENTKFMDLRQLRRIHADPMRSRRIRELHADITRQEQEGRFITGVIQTLRQRRLISFDDGRGQMWTLEVGGRNVSFGRLASSMRVIATGEARSIQLFRGEGRPPDLARQLTLLVQADPGAGRMRLAFDMEDVIVGASEGQTQSAQRSFSRPFSIAMPAELRHIEQRPVQWYAGQAPTAERHFAEPRAIAELQRRLQRLRSGIIAEIHGRCSFAVSCLILVVAGCALGMMFRTGNYLGAFAISVAPALLSIALIVTGQHVCENDPRNLGLGLGLIWGGNAAALALGGVLLGRLQRQ
jgi:lipopolysaccharide export LptBFGC system permease protein LptF